MIAGSWQLWLLSEWVDIARAVSRQMALFLAIMNCNNQASKLCVCITVAKLDSDKNRQASGAVQKEGDIPGAPTIWIFRCSKDNTFLVREEVTYLWYKMTDIKSTCLSDLSVFMLIFYNKLSLPIKIQTNSSMQFY